MDFDSKLYGLAFGCPYLDRDDNCIMMLVEELSFCDKYYWINSLSSDEKQRMLDHHMVCSKNKI